MSDTAQTLSLLLECPICLGPFTDPRLLTGCFHTLCYKCLNDHIGQSGQGGRFQCPICRRSLEIPNGRADDFPRNYFANSCLDVLADSATGERGPAAGCDQGQVADKVCSNSEEGDECAEAVQFCLDCCDKYCQQCSKVHRKTRATSKHKQVALDELSDDMLNEAMSKLETPSCPKHQGKSLELYCSTCQCAVCSICCHIDHQSHTFKEMKDVDEGLKAELGPLVTTVEVLKESVKCQIREVDKTTEVYKKNASKARESVKGLFQQMQQMLSQKAAEIDQVICRKYDEAKVLANSRSKNLVLNGQFLESLSSFAQNLQRKGSVFNRLASLPEVCLQVEKLKQSVDNMLSVPEVPSHTELFAESVDNLMIETDIELDPHNPEETRKIKVLQTSKIYSENKSVTGNDQGQTADAAGAGKIGGYIGLFQGLVVPPGHTTSGPPVLIPPPVMRSDINPNIVQFWLQSGENRKAIEQGLLGLHCRIVWPEKAAGNLKLECSLKENDPNLHTLPDVWARDVNEHFSKMADNYEATDISIRAQCFQSVVGKLKEVTHPDVMILGVSSEKCLVRLAGKKQAVADMVDAIRKQEEKIETGLKHETLKMGKPQMSKRKFKLMQLYDQPDRIRQKYPDMQVELCGKDETATLKGPKENLQQAKLDILKFTSGITSRVWTVSNNMLRFLQSEIASLIDDRLKQAGARVIWETGDAITITGATSQECDKGKTLLKKMIRESTMSLENMDTRFFMEATWTNFKEQTESNKPVRLFVANNEREQSHLCIVGFSDEVDSVEEQAKDYIEQNSIMKETVQVDPGTATLLLNHLNTELIDMRRSRRFFQVECSADSSNSAIDFCGNPESMKAARNKLENIRQQMLSKTHPLSGPGMQKAFSGERAKLFCLSMERKHGVVVKLIEKGGATKPRLRGAEASSWRGDAEGQETLVRNLPFKETRHSNVIQTQNIRVTLRKGSIESEQTAVVVNPLDRDLDLKKTATSRALLKAAGGQLEEEFRSNVEKSEVKPGSIIETKGWNLSSWAVYHGVLVGWDSPGDQAERVMQELLQKCFQTAEDNRIPSMSLPPAGTGKLGYPAEKVAQIILAEIASFGRRQPPNLTDIHIIVHPKDVKKQEIFERAFCSAVGKNEPSQRGNGTHVDRDTSSSLAGSAGDVDENKFKVGSISLIIKTGDITKERAGAIVNSSNPRLDLSRGAVQRAIARAGGDAVERECRETTVRNGIAVTTAGKMDARKIIHLAPSSRDRDGLLWQKLVKRALDEAENLGLKTVAFPAVGTGSGHQDVRDVAKSMVEGLAYFEKNTKPRSVKVVTFTIFQHEMVDTFKDAAKRFSQGRGQKGRSPLGRASVESGALARDIELQIYAMSDVIIRDVEREIADYAEESKITGEVDDPLIKKLTDKQKKDIRTFASSRDVEVDFQTKTLNFGRNSASIKGHANDVMLVNDHISKILKDIQKAKHEKETGKVMSRQVQWEFQDPQGPFKAYPDDVNLKIETAYLNKKATIEWNKGSKRMKITFNDMMGEIVGDPGKKVSVRRIEQGGIGPPAHWSPMNPNEPFKLVPVATTDKVYTAIVADFQKTMGSRTIKKIERVQNPIIYSRYMTHKTQLDKHNPSGTVNEMFLWHGTNHTSAQNIISGGFNRSYCGQHGTAYGNGVYFATAASYSAQPGYSPPNPQGEQCMFYSRVLTGVATQGSSGLREAPPRPGGGSFTRFDSVVDKPSSPNMYIVFTDTAAYPDHLVTF